MTQLQNQIIEKLKDRISNLQAIIRHCDSPEFDNPRFEMVLELTKKDKTIESELSSLESQLKETKAEAITDNYVESEWNDNEGHKYKVYSKQTPTNILSKYPYVVKHNIKCYEEEDVLRAMDEFQSCLSEKFHSRQEPTRRDEKKLVQELLELLEGILDSAYWGGNLDQDDIEIMENAKKYLNSKPGDK